MRSLPSEARLARRLTVAVVAALFAFACAGRETEEPREEVGSKRDAVTATVPLTITLPEGVELERTALGANDYVRFKDRSVISAPTGSGLTANAGAREVTLSASSRVRSVTAQGPVTAWNNARIEGDLRAGGAFTAFLGAVVTGTRADGVAFGPPTVLSSSVVFPGGGADVNLEPPQAPRTLAPGVYGNLSVKSGPALTLTSGTYYFDSVRFEPGATLRVTTTSTAPLVVYVHGVFDFKGVFSQTGAPEDVFFAVFNAGTTSLETALNGTVAVPNGTLRIAPANKTFRGSYFAKAVEVEPDITVAFTPFRHWSRIFPVIPIVECVAYFDSTHASAVFGYENRLATTFTVAPGANNRLSPAGSVTPRQTFLPGRHRAAVVAPFDGTSATWFLAGTSAVANSSTRRCDLQDFPKDPAPQVDLEGSSPRAAALGSLAGNTLLGLRREPAALSFARSFQQIPTATMPPGGDQGGVGSVSLPLTVNPFRVVITRFTLGSDAACHGGEPFVRVTANGETEQRTLDTDCDFIEACNATYFPDEVLTLASVTASATQVAVRVRLFDRDSFLCGGDGVEEEVDVSFTVDNATGRVLSGHADTCASDDGWQICWRIEPNGRPRACGFWNAQFVDSGTGEDFANNRAGQSVRASFSRAKLTLSNSDTNTTTVWNGVLDQSGCMPLDESPEVAQWRMGPQTAVTARFELSTQHCFDPTGDNCRDPATGNDKGARFMARRFVNGGTTATGPDTVCTVLTTDPALTAPNCLVLHPAEGAFNAWVGGLPPAEIAIGNGTHSSSTRVAATVSEMLRREVQTNGDMAVAFALIERAGPGGSLVNFDIDTTCALSDGQGNIIDRDTCRSGNTLRIRPDMLCSSPRIRDCMDLMTGAFTPCNPGVDQNCVTGDSWWKYTLMHEFGHFVQGAAIGGLSPSYSFNGAPDLPGAPPVCGCGHVLGANALHCLQSLEQPNAAQIEGWAQFYTSKVWNDERGPDCTFNYYKEFLFPGAAAAVPPPVPVSCKTPVRWRNTHCIGAPSFSGTGVADMGTELDWMGFLWNVNTAADNASTMRNISDAYVLACSSPNAPTLCDGGDTVTWEATPGTGSLSTGAQSLFAGDAPRAQLFQQMGDLYGVSRDTAPGP